ncbi:MAG: hypothetical protein KME21_15245 [Desmonostoc vinosum HA7617-LM4]|jgi:hypothetical protein|nr:hypothetical protein [Desmonostoc vinosum HA7617-LM4]
MSTFKARVSSSSVSVRGLSYTNTTGAGSSINVIATSPTGRKISKKEEVFIIGATSNKTTVTANDSSITFLISIDGDAPAFIDTSSSQETDFFGNNALLRTADRDILIGTAGNNNLQETKGNNANFIADFSASRDYKIDIVANIINQKDLVFAGFDSTHDGKADTILIQYQQNDVPIFGGDIL